MGVNGAHEGPRVEEAQGPQGLRPSDPKEEERGLRAGSGSVEREGFLGEGVLRGSTLTESVREV